MAQFSAFVLIILLFFLPMFTKSDVAKRTKDDAAAFVSRLLHLNSTRDGNATNTTDDNTVVVGALLARDNATAVELTTDETVAELSNNTVILLADAEHSMANISIDNNGTIFTVDNITVVSVINSSTIPSVNKTVPNDNTVVSTIIPLISTLLHGNDTNKSISYNSIMIDETTTIVSNVSTVTPLSGVPNSKLIHNSTVLNDKDGLSDASILIKNTRPNNDDITAILLTIGHNSENGGINAPSSKIVTAPPDTATIQNTSSTAAAEEYNTTTVNNLTAQYSEIRLAYLADRFTNWRKNSSNSSMVNEPLFNDSTVTKLNDTVNGETLPLTMDDDLAFNATTESTTTTTDNSTVTTSATLSNSAATEILELTSSTTNLETTISTTTAPVIANQTNTTKPVANTLMSTIILTTTPSSTTNLTTETLMTTVSPTTMMDNNTTANVSFDGSLWPLRNLSRLLYADASDKVTSTSSSADTSVERVVPTAATASLRPVNTKAEPSQTRGSRAAAANGARFVAAPSATLAPFRVYEDERQLYAGIVGQVDDSSGGSGDTRPY